jgi:hypothetical protein
MSNIDDFMASYQNHQKAIAEANAINKNAVFDALAATEISSVTVTFDGEGDSGQIEEITAHAGDNPQPLPDTQIEIQYVAWGSGKLDSSQSPLREAIEKLCYDFLEQEHGGWENNDGAFGEFTLDVAARTVDLEFNGRYTDVHSSDHTF